MSAVRPLLFGSFDGLHEGHQALLKQAATVAGEKVHVCLALDEDIVKRKGRAPKYAFHDRMQALQGHELVASVTPGDREDGVYSVVQSLRPTHIFFGYDQEGLREHLKKWLDERNEQAELITLEPFQPETYKSSIINRE